MNKKITARETGTVEIFVDDSNIHFGGMNHVLRTMEPEVFNNEKRRFSFRVHQSRLVEKILVGRQLRFGCAVGVVLPGQNVPEEYLSGYSGVGFKIFRWHRAEYDHGKETDVDETIQKKMLEAIRFRKPGTMVLVSGDGNGREEGKGFIPVLEKAVAAGWRVEVVSWKRNTNRYLVEYARAHGSFTDLEPSYYELTFVCGWRRAGERAGRPGNVFWND